MGTDDESGDSRAGVVRGCKRGVWPPGGVRSQSGFACHYGGQSPDAGSTLRGYFSCSRLSPCFSEVIDDDVPAGVRGAPLIEIGCQLRIHGVATAYPGTAVGDLRATFG